MAPQPQKRLKQVKLAKDVFSLGLQHALSSEKEEIMGLLIGEVNEETCTSNITHFIILQRSDKQPDRVEISPEQLASATTYAEEISCKLEKTKRVVGWYHSHPHITVFPSHIDLRTQAMYQQMDSYFVGLIYSVFNHKTGSMPTSNEIQVTCFQSDTTSEKEKQIEVPVHLEDAVFSVINVMMMAKWPQILREEEKEQELVACTMKTIPDSLHLAAAEYKVLLERLEVSEQQVKCMKIQKTELLKKLEKLERENASTDAEKENEGLAVEIPHPEKETDDSEERGKEIDASEDQEKGIEDSDEQEKQN